MLSKKKRRELLLLVAERLAELYPEAECALEYGADPWRLLVMARLSAQCTDARVNIVSRELFSKFPTVEAMANADIGELENVVRPCGLYRMKADGIKKSSEMLIERFDGVVPKTMDELLTLPGVGRKIANLLLGDVYGLPAVVCDTHCIRICGRLGLYSEKLKDPGKIENILRELFGEELIQGSDFCHRIVIFGREICSARSPRCAECPLGDICVHNGKGGGR
jgi:endonuclease-3